jgi:putative DNA primase/helicase
LNTKAANFDWTPFQSTRCTDADLVGWFGNGTSSNAGVVLGPVSGVVVIESDNQKAEAWCKVNLASTSMMTCSARGFHRYYRLPTALRGDSSSLPASIHADGFEIELKRDGQYVMAPGSVHPSGHIYAMVEEWPSSLDDVPTLPFNVLKGASSGQSSARPPLPPTIPNGNRNSALWTEACRMRRLGLDADEIFGALNVINRKRCSPPLDGAELKSMAHRATRYQPAADTFPLTEAGDAEFFASVFGDAVRYDHLRGRWLLFNGHIWAPQSDGQVPRLALDAMRARQRAAIGDKDKLKWTTQGESRKRLTNLLAIAQTVKPLADDGENWDRDPMLLAVANGVVELQTGTLRDGRPEDRITMRCPVAFDPAATCATWEQFLADVFQDADLIRYVQRAAGYSLTGDCREECLFFCWGLGANGKGTLMNTLAWTIGDYADDLPFSALELHERSGIPNDIAKIVGKRFVTASESGETTRLNESRVKALTGRDPVTARFLHREFFTFQPVAKFWLATNKKPIVRDDSQGFWRRLHLIPFTQSFVGREDKTLKDRLRAEGEGILAWVVRGCLDWQREGLSPPDVVREATEAYRLESDSLNPFYDACCLIDARARVQASAFFVRYQRWCEANRIRPEQRLTQTAFGKQVKTRFAFEEKRHVVYLGIGLRHEPE